MNADCEASIRTVPAVMHAMDAIGVAAVCALSDPMVAIAVIAFKY